MRLLFNCVALLAVMTVALAAPDLPLTRVVLFSSGVGYFEREGKVDGDASFELSFRTSQINDILKSMVLQDLGGGTIAPVTYAPQDPLVRTLSSFAVDLSDNPSMMELWDMLRGARVKVSSDRTYEGVVFGAEEQDKSVGDEIMKVQVLNMLTDKGLMAVPLWHVNSIEIMDADLAKDLGKALEAINKARDTNKRPVVLDFRGKGARGVRVGYLLETPVWKTSYRLVADDKGLLLQGWAIVENTTDDDWENVGLSMVSGQPVSFIQDLYEPLYIQRPVIQPSVQVAARPQVWDADMAPAEDEMMAEAAPERAKKSLRRAPASLAPPSPAMAMGMGAMAAPTAGGAFDLRESGAAAMAEGGKVGTLFQYAINQPVTVPRQRSAMIPIINAEVQGERVSVYKMSANAKHPMNGIMMKNSSPLHLMAGPITVFADNVYGGDALIEDVAPGDERLLTYAVDLSVEVDPESKSRPSEFMSATLYRGIMTITSKVRTEMNYTVKNKADEKRVVLIEHPLREDWKLVEPEKPGEKTRSAYRFRMEVEPGKTQKLTVAEERPMPEIVRIVDRGPDQIAVLLKMPELSEQMKTALRGIMAMQETLAGLQSQLDEKQTRITEIEEEQERIRNNMRELDRQSALYRQYVEKFTKQETEFETLRDDSKVLRAKMEDEQKKIQDHIMGLTVK